MTDSIAATKILVDTNILIDAADLQAGDKHLRAVELIDDLTAQNRMVVSAQVLNEFYHATTRPTAVYTRVARARGTPPDPPSERGGKSTHAPEPNFPPFRRGGQGGCFRIGCAACATMSKPL